jgi:hypothetical protein
LLAAQKYLMMHMGLGRCLKCFPGYNMGTLIFRVPPRKQTQEAQRWVVVTPGIKNSKKI